MKVNPTIDSMEELFVYQTGRHSLIIENTADGEFANYLVGSGLSGGLPINDTGAMVWERCEKAIRVAELIRDFHEVYPEVPGLESDIKEILLEFRDLKSLGFSDTHYATKTATVNHTVDYGIRSIKAERLVDFCLGDHVAESIPACSRNFRYLNDRQILLLESTSNKVQLTAGIKSRQVVDTKKIVDALVSQRTRIPDNWSCWVARGDSSGANSDPSQGIHIAGMRRKVHRHLVLVPSACRNRVLGNKLKSQMKELRTEWCPWPEKTDTAWWGGALTGDWWSNNEPRTITRREVLEHFARSPSDRVHLQMTQLSGSVEPPKGVGFSGKFTKKQAFSHKCIILLPGNDIASGSSWYFCGNSVVLMPRPHIEHILYFEMEPWQHYVPLENDPDDILVKLDWVLKNQEEAQEIVRNSHQRLKWLCGPEYKWACNEVLRIISRQD